MQPEFYLGGPTLSERMIQLGIDQHNSPPQNTFNTEIKDGESGSQGRGILGNHRTVTFEK